jgi:hypothetical protein
MGIPLSAMHHWVFVDPLSAISIIFYLLLEKAKVGFLLTAFLCVNASVSFSLAQLSDEVAGSTSELLFAKAGEMRRRIEVVLSHDVAEGCIRFGQTVAHMFCFLFQDPLVGRRAEFGLEFVVKIGPAHARKVGEFVYAMHLEVIIQYQASELEGLSDDGVEESGQFFLRILCAEDEKQFLVFYFMQTGTVDLFLHIQDEQIKKFNHWRAKRKRLEDIGDIRK